MGDGMVGAPTPKAGDVWAETRTCQDVEVVAVAKRVDDWAPVVVYRVLSTGEVWVCPLPEWAAPLRGGSLAGPPRFQFPPAKRMEV